MSAPIRSLVPVPVGGGGLGALVNAVGAVDDRKLRVNS